MQLCLCLRGSRFSLFRLCFNLKLLALLAFQNGVRHGLGDQLDRADGVVVAWDDIVDLVRIAVGVNDRNDRDTQLASLGNRVLLLAGVDHEQRARAASSFP